MDAKSKPMDMNGAHIVAEQLIRMKINQLQMSPIDNISHQFREFQLSSLENLDIPTHLVSDQPIMDRMGQRMVIPHQIPISIPTPTPSPSPYFDFDKFLLPPMAQQRDEKPETPILNPRFIPNTPLLFAGGQLTPNTPSMTATRSQPRPITKDLNVVTNQFPQNMPFCILWPRLNQLVMPFMQPTPRMVSPIDHGGQSERKKSADQPLAAGMYCTFCKRNGERAQFYLSHLVKDDHGRVICPILRDYLCPHCGATGDEAHTASYCPKKPNSVERSFARTKIRGRMASGKLRPMK